MNLTIISPLQQQQFTIVWLEINTTVGNFVIQQGHAPMVVILAPQEKITFCLANGKRESLTIKEGIAHIVRMGATLIVNDSVV